MLQNNYFDDDEEEDGGGEAADGGSVPYGGGFDSGVARSTALGLRVRQPKPAPNYRAPEARPRQKPRRNTGYDSDAQPRRGNKRGGRVSYAEDDEDGSGDSDEDGKRKGNAVVKVDDIAALMDDSIEVDDEVERVLNHRLSACLLLCPHCLPFQLKRVFMSPGEWQGAFAFVTGPLH